MEIKMPLYATEDREKLMKAVLSVFPDAKFESSDMRLTAESAQPAILIEMIKKRKIVPTAIRELRRHGCLTLNKQAFVAGKINFVDSAHPLGNIEVYVDGGFIDLLSAEASSPP